MSSPLREGGEQEEVARDVSLLPWRVGEMCAGQLWIKNDVGRPIGLVGTHHRLALEANANARLIVRCVNSHDALLAALKALVESLNDDLSDEQCAAWDQARAVIAKAEGR